MAHRPNLTHKATSCSSQFWPHAGPVQDHLPLPSLQYCSGRSGTVPHVAPSPVPSPAGLEQAVHELWVLKWALHGHSPRPPRAGTGSGIWRRIEGIQPKVPASCHSSGLWTSPRPLISPVGPD